MEEQDRRGFGVLNEQATLERRDGVSSVLKEPGFLGLAQCLICDYRGRHPVSLRALCSWPWG